MGHKMGNYVDLVLVRSRMCGDVLLCAPAWSRLMAGDQVIYRKDGISAVVVDVLTVSIETYSFACKIVGAENLPRISAKVTFSDFHYEDEEQEEVTDG